jgi:hypothetical protein
MTRALPIFIFAALGLAILVAYTVAKTALFIVILTGFSLVLLRTCLNRTALERLGSAPAAIALGLPLVAWLLPSVWLLYAAMLGLLPALATRPGQVPALYLFALLLLPALDQSVVLGSVKLFEFGVHDALALGGGLTLWRRPGWRTRRRIALDLPFILFLLVLVFIGARGTSVTNLLRTVLNLVMDFGVPYLLVSRGVRSRDDLRLCMLHLAVAATMLSVILLYEARSFWPMYNELHARFGVEAQLLIKARGGIMRAGGPFLESTSMAMALTVCFLAAWLSRSAFRSRLHHRAVLAVLVVGLLVPQSRGAWIGLLIGMAVVDLYSRRLDRLVLRTVVVGCAGAVLFALAQTTPDLSESLGMSGGSTATADYRRALLDRGTEEFWHRPVIGYSMPELTERLADLRQGEGIIDFVNAYLFFALAAGTIGLGVFVGAFVFYIRLALTAGGRAAPDRDVTAFIVAGLVMPMEMLFFTSLGGRCELFVYVFFAMATALAGTGTMPGRERGAPDPEPMPLPSFGPRQPAPLP